MLFFFVVVDVAAANINRILSLNHIWPTKHFPVRATYIACSVRRGEWKRPRRQKQPNYSTINIELCVRATFRSLIVCVWQGWRHGPTQNKRIFLRKLFGPLGIVLSVIAHLWSVANEGGRDQVTPNKKINNKHHQPPKIYRLSLMINGFTRYPLAHKECNTELFLFGLCDRISSYHIIW